MNSIYRATTTTTTIKVFRNRISATFLQHKQQQCQPQQRKLSNTASCSAGGKLRVSRGQADDASSYGPLTDLPDFTIIKRSKKPVISVSDVDKNSVISDAVGDEFSTSQPPVAVMTKRQMRRQMQRVSIGATIASLLKEIDEQKVEEGKYGILEEQHRDY